MGNKASKDVSKRKRKKSDKKRKHDKNRTKISKATSASATARNHHQGPKTDIMSTKKPRVKAEETSPAVIIKIVEDEGEVTEAREELGTADEHPKAISTGRANWSNTGKAGTATESKTSLTESTAIEQKSAPTESAVTTINNVTLTVPPDTEQVDHLDLDNLLVNDETPSAQTVEEKEVSETGDDEIDDKREKEDILGNLHSSLGDLNLSGGIEDLLADVNVSLPSEPLTGNPFDLLSEELGDVKKFEFKDQFDTYSDEEIEFKFENDEDEDFKFGNDEDEEDKKDIILPEKQQSEEIDSEEPKLSSTEYTNPALLAKSFSAPVVALKSEINYDSGPGYKTSTLLSSLQSSQDEAKKVVTSSDIIALNNVPSIKNPAMMTKELELADMWEILGSALVKHQGVRSLILEMSTPLNFKDLPLLTRWAQSKLHCSEVRASCASQAQVFELNALKKQSRKRPRRKKRRPRQRSLQHRGPGGSFREEKQKGRTGFHTRRSSYDAVFRSKSTYLSPHRHQNLRRRKSHSSHRMRNPSLSESRKKSVSLTKKTISIKCLFLDIEGVITPIDGPQLPRRHIELPKVLAEKLLVLKHITYVTGCKLVLTSVARKDRGFIDFVNRILKAWGINPLYSVTRPLPKEVGLVRLLPENKRAREVEQWLFSRKVKSWCVVDTMDLSVLEKDGVDRTVMVNGQIGLTPADGRLVVNILGDEPELYR